MNMIGCEHVRTMLAARARNDAGPEASAEVEAHLTDCDACRAEARLLRLLLLSRPPTPPELAARIEAAVRNDGRSTTVRRPWWGLAAAAVAAVAVGIGVVSDSPLGVDVPVYAAEAAATGPWLSVEGEVAGAPTLDDLSDEALLELLDELGAGASGGGGGTA